MRTIIAGSRGITSPHIVDSAARASGIDVTVVLSGTANGADKLGEAWAEANGIPVERYPADWNKHGKSAGYKRNELMATKADALIAIWDGESKGTKHMMDIATRAGLKVYKVYAPTAKQMMG